MRISRRGGGFFEKARVSRRKVMNGEGEERENRSAPGMDSAKGHTGPIGV